MNWNQGSSNRAPIRTSLGGARSLSSASSQAKQVASNPEPILSKEFSDIAIADEDKQEHETPLKVDAEEEIQGFVTVNHSLDNNSELGSVDKSDPISPVSKDQNGPSTQEVNQESRHSSTERDTPVRVYASGVPQNIANQEDSSAESGEISDNLPGKGDIKVGELDPEGDDTHNSEEMVNDIEDQRDAMMEYSNSEQPAPQSRETPVLEPPKTLADLDAEDLRIQLRYFYITRDPHSVPDTDPIRCLVCAKPGHMAGGCPSLTCSTCGAHKEHFTHSCPQTEQCDRCAERGHKASKCKYKLKPVNNKLTCMLCNLEGHFDGDCELRWRTSGRPWGTTIPVLSVLRYCYECGNSGHLGNDCLSRRPGKPMGSSTWSEHGLPTPNTAASRLPNIIPGNLSQIPKVSHTSVPKGSTSINIKGRAQRMQGPRQTQQGKQHRSSHKLPPKPPPRDHQTIINISSSSEDDRAAFHRPRISNAPKAGRGRGGMRFAPNTIAKLPEPPSRGSTHRDQRGGAARNQDFRDNRDDYKNNNNSRNDFRDDRGGDYYRRGHEGRRGGGRRRSRSPVGQRRDRERDRQPDSYRPMPSAGERAWKRGRM